MITYRTAGAWGAGKGSNLTAAEVDENFYDHEQRIADLEENPTQPNNISNIEVVGTQMTIHIEGGDSYGPFTLPQANFRPSIVETLDVQTDGVFTPAADDGNKYFRCAEACTVHLPSTTEVALPVDTEITFRQTGAGAISFDRATDTVINVRATFLPETAGLHATVTAKKVGDAEWDLVGEMAEDVTA